MGLDLVIRRPLLLLLVVAVSVKVGVPQERTCALLGQVLDPAGKPIPGAAVAVAGPALVRAQSTITDSGGAYLFPSLPPGPYTISVAAKGFATFKRPGLQLQVGRQIRVDAELEVGQVNESLLITAEAVPVDTTTTVVSTNVPSDLYDRLPKGRSFDSLVAMAPGVRFEVKQGGFQVDGASGSENVFVIDGVEVSGIYDGLLSPQNRVPIEWIAETQIKSSGLDAQYGGSIGGVVSAITRSGGNRFHGQLSLYLEDDGANARPRPVLRLNPGNDNTGEYFDQSKDGFRRYNPGFRLGGPLVRDRLWFFVSSYPQLDEYKRTATVLNPRITREFSRRERQDFAIAKIDFALSRKLRATLSYLYMPQRVNGSLPARDGTDPAANPWADRGYRAPQTGYNYQADWALTSALSLSAFGGFNYRNRKDYGVPGGTRYRFQTPSLAIEGLPENLRRESGDLTPDNRQDLQDIFTRHNLNVLGSYLTRWGGEHNLRFGYQLNRLHNDPIVGARPDGFVQIYWNSAYTAITKPGTFRGKYGYYRNINLATYGAVSSSNQGLFLQDHWRLSRRLNLSLGLRTEREFVPSFTVTNQIPSEAIKFGFGRKLAPRLGFSWDPSGAGWQKVYFSFGVYYDIMKYALPRGSFGGDKWKDYYYTLDTLDIFSIRPDPAPNSGQGQFPGTLIEILDRRIPSNDPSKNLIDPNLKPVQQRQLDLGYEYNFRKDWVAGLRYVHKQLVRTIEDVGLLTPEGEQYFIANPGEGISIDPARFPPGYPNPANPRAKRRYDALELRLERRFSGRYFIIASYAWSRLYGNYGGLASSDENGRTDPNVSRYFDEAWMNYDRSGRLVEGRLATDRPHSLKVFASHEWKWRGGSTRLSPLFYLQSGTPVSTEYDVQDVPVFINGRGDLGRTPVYSQTDLALMHDFRFRGMSESRRFRVELNVTNLFNQATVIDRFNMQSHSNDGAITFGSGTAAIFQGYDALRMGRDRQDENGNPQPLRIDPRYNRPSKFADPRSLRFGVHFFF